MKSAAKIVTDAVLGLDFRMVRVGGRVYRVDPPTIWKLAGAANCLVPAAEARGWRDLLASAESARCAARALSWFIRGDGGLEEELSAGTPAEVADALAAAYGLLSVRDFLTLSALARNVVGTAARQRQ